MKKWLFGLVACLMVILGACQTQTAQTEQVFRVGMEANYAPYNWTQTQSGKDTAPIENTGEFAGGYDVAIAQKIADKLGKKLVIVKTEWDGLIPSLQAGKIDAIIAGMSPTAERKQEIDFTDSYYMSTLVLVIRKDGAYANAHSLKDFSGARVTGQLGTLHYDLLDQMKTASKQEAMSDFSAMRVALESGKIDAYISEKSTAIDVVGANNQLKMIEFKDNNGFVVSEEDVATSIGLPKNSELTEKINTILKQISPSEREDLMKQAIRGETTQESQHFFMDMWIVLKKNWPQLVDGATKTLYISLIGTIIGLFIGLCIGIIRTIPRPKEKGKNLVLSLVNGLLSVYIEIFRGTPMIVQAMVVYYGSALLFGFDMDRLVAALLIVSINTGAYMSEVVRGGIISIDKGQFEAAQAIGMTHLQTMRYVVLPQVLKNILPATGNEFVINIKDTSVLNVIGVTELFFVTRSIAGRNYQFFQTFLVTCVFYFVMTFTVTRLLRFIEKRLSGKSTDNLASGQMQVAEIKET
ncbi:MULTISPECIES: ABC transporter substrate-binding protein/permease [unclassified Granulicatella]|uniref:ABC transporter substrate-binding protein/permease n=1 Tax=unclassified Granulicatella TaxID=2630493 RepID=UPI0010740A60|nr:MULTISPECIES: ABC transporter substrate-binding protein/permease [unclassified Granulicatella]MBF0781142.1 ABC transporter substrate-binding protein/permease [Granulicatella sp. 19428wC4_WM01]TFU91790.1 transporter substrate-binding domain-containing protein [Granulicatella sp. WM01]